MEVLRRRIISRRALNKEAALRDAGVCVIEGVDRIGEVVRAMLFAMLKTDGAHSN